ncbi:MAG: hypothetical protein WHS64_08835 [Fervidobacterium sp.]|uniref:Uncharacterized protein n=1 Tax=Fervidobacterium gondwanense DSM 13020 TaxID=1121883 RepID=A0A1M7TEX7_FERGO|nr:hypothetical protein [Fervidobacterium gondwanense]UXF01866.1 hypothetical protein IB67_10235 [Fervidobacterium riparium]SHN69324.1 hypothetical protein SAMN02745226_01933 [Fervidobacterium gondwanense DSM 13020]
MAIRQKQEQRQETKLKQSQVLVDERVIVTSGSEEETIYDITESYDDDASQSSERIDSQLYGEWSIDLEIGIKLTPKKSFLVVKTDVGYKLLFSGDSEEKVKGLVNLFASFFPFEELSKEKLLYVLEDERQGEYKFSIDRSLNDKSVLLPNGEIVPIVLLKRKKGRIENQEDKDYREFRGLIFDEFEILEELKKKEYFELLKKMLNGKSVEDFPDVFYEVFNTTEEKRERLRNLLKNKRVKSVIEEIVRNANS